MTALEMFKKIKSAGEVTISDVSQYEWGRSHNGGAYSETTTYFLKDGKWWAHDTTSCELVEDDEPYEVDFRTVFRSVRYIMSQESPEDWDVWIGNEQVF